MQRMTAGDASWYRMDRPRNEADVVALLTFRGPVALARVRRLVEERLLAVERFRQRPVPRLLGAPGWEPDPGFSLRRHLVPVELARGTLPEFVGEVTSSRLDPAHPLWRVHVVRERGRGGAIVAKLHHALGDGFALVALLLALSDEHAAEEAPRAHVEAVHRGRPWLGSARLAAARDAAAFAATLARLAAMSSDPKVLSAAELSGVRRVAWSGGVPLGAVREAGHRRGATVNDVLVAAIAGALRSLLASRRAPLVPVRALVPVNFRPARPDLGADASLGNRFGVVFLDLPIDLGTPVARLEAVHARVAALRAGAGAVVAHDVLALAGYAPDAVQHALTRFFARKASLVLTNLPGPRTRVHLAGLPLASAMFWVPHPASLGLGVSVLSYAGEVRVGVRSDAAVLAEPADLVGRIEAEAAALGVRGPRPPRPPRPTASGARARARAP
ncbi:WS/DGAT domain-containing protein [Anaeromyxobacter sp. SG66]|uniref:WS/DGAT domain-containing protein n=1 Tax=Anaeromyxobacter sp. SG66 TaxID=2925410 RepID=UPI001F58C2F8|nr:WS/DGAT domain-containing protein [Anaeromyxobacter sp. SG66]